ncbi:MAG: radical SAM family heme chaperone HemW [Pseudoprimorskyibacter sp.]|nr:radical SAM family heme chaperone HemW [Pseudoprimorskyibacter sp.]
MIEDWQYGGFGIYIHWPFCAAKCPYCDFNSHVSTFVDHEAWLTAYLRQLDRCAAETPGRLVRSVFFGGGTPSLMKPSVVDRILNRIQQLWPLTNDVEITLEANPTSIDSAKFAEFSSAGINRVSIGIQSLNDADLRRLGRLHSVQEAMTALEIAQKQFARVSFDLIYARQDQSLSSWETELVQALSFAPDHLSLYQLTIEPDTAFALRQAAGKLAGLPNHDLSADMYQLTQYICDAAGLPAYEISNHAKPGQESRHNLIYWHYGDYLGIGPGAHGRVTLDGARYATETPLSPADWLHSALEGSGESKRYSLSPVDQAGEYLMMGLRINEGLNIDRYEGMAQKKLDQLSVDNLIKDGLAFLSGRRLILTKPGRMVLNSIVVALMPIH